MYKVTKFDPSFKKEVKELVQVCRDMKDKVTRDRELDGIREAASATGCHQMTIVTRDQEEVVQAPLGTIHIVPAWNWMLENEITK